MLKLQRPLFQIMVYLKVRWKDVVEVSYLKNNLMAVFQPLVLAENFKIWISVETLLNFTAHTDRWLIPSDVSTRRGDPILGSQFSLHLVHLTQVIAQIWRSSASVACFEPSSAILSCFWEIMRSWLTSVHQNYWFPIGPFQLRNPYGLLLVKNFIFSLHFPFSSDGWTFSPYMYLFTSWVSRDSSMFLWISEIWLEFPCHRNLERRNPAEEFSPEKGWKTNLSPKTWRWKQFRWITTPAVSGERYSVPSLS